MLAEFVGECRYAIAHAAERPNRRLNHGIRRRAIQCVHRDT
jgi:hypothetical protein